MSESPVSLTPRQLAQRKYKQSEKGKAAQSRANAAREEKRKTTEVKLKRRGEYHEYESKPEVQERRRLRRAASTLTAAGIRIPVSLSNETQESISTQITEARKRAEKRLAAMAGRKG